MTNPFTKSLDEFRGQHVHCVSNDGRTYQGFVERLHHHDRHVVLRGATNQAGDHVGRVLVSHVDVLETTEPTGRVERIALDAVTPAPYHAREFDAADNRGYIARVRSDGWAGSFPTVRPADDDGDLEHPGDAGFEIVAGHKRLWVAGEAGLETHPVHIIEIDDWTATQRFVADHLPSESDLRGNGESHDGYYTQVEIEAAIERLVERWGGRALDIERVAFNVARLGLQDVVDTTGDDDESTTTGMSAATDETSAAAGNDSDDDEEVACDIPGCAYTGTERGLSIHHARAHQGDDGREPPGLEQIKSLRAARGWTQSDLADELGVKNSTVANWETQYSSPSDANASQLWTLHEETNNNDEEGSETARSDTDPTPGDSEDTGGYPCMDCGRAFDSQRALSIHQGHKHTDHDSDSNRVDDTTGNGGGSETDNVPTIRSWNDTDTQTRGDDEVDEDDERSTYPKECSCGVACERHLEYLVHRTEAHGSPQQDLGHLQPGEFEELAEQSETILELADSLGWKPERTLRVLVIYGFNLTDSDGEFAKNGSASDILGGMTDAAADAVATDAVDEPSPAGGERA